MLLEELAAEDRESNAGIVSAGQHESVEQLFYSVDLAGSKISHRPLDLRLETTYLNLLSFHTNSVFFT